MITIQFLCHIFTAIYMKYRVLLPPVTTDLQQPVDPLFHKKASGWLQALFWCQYFSLQGCSRRSSLVTNMDAIKKKMQAMKVFQALVFVWISFTVPRYPRWRRTMPATRWTPAKKQWRLQRWSHSTSKNVQNLLLPRSELKRARTRWRSWTPRHYIIKNKIIYKRWIIAPDQTIILGL